MGYDSSLRRSHDVPFGAAVLPNRRAVRFRLWAPAALYVYMKVLALRWEHPQLFTEGEYLPLSVNGARQVYVCAFARRFRDSMIVVLAPRWFATLTDEGRRQPIGDTVWKETRVELPAGDAVYRNALTGERFVPARTENGASLQVGRVLAHFPLALLQAFPVETAPGESAAEARR